MSPRDNHFWNIIQNFIDNLFTFLQIDTRSGYDSLCIWHIWEEFNQNPESESRCIRPNCHTVGVLQVIELATNLK